MKRKESYIKVLVAKGQDLISKGQDLLSKGQDWIKSFGGFKDNKAQSSKARAGKAHAGRAYASKAQTSKAQAGKAYASKAQTSKTRTTKGQSSKLQLDKLNRKRLAGVALASVVIAGSALFYLTNTTVAAYVVVDGERIGLVESAAVGEEMLEQILSEYGSSVGQVGQQREEVTFEQQRVKRSLLETQKLFKEDLARQLDIYVEGYVLKIGDERVALLPSAEAVDSIIEEYKTAFAQPADAESVEISSVEVVEEISTEKVEVKLAELEKPEQVLERLLQGHQTVQEYVVEEGDSWWLIARKNNMLTDEVLAGNPDLSEDSTLYPGQVIKLVDVTPYLTVVSKGKYTTTEVIPFDVITKTDYSLASGKTKVIAQGSDGSKKVTYEFTQKNGKIVEKSVENEVILEKPVDQVIAKGPSAPKVAAANSATLSRGSGAVPSFIWPLKGKITSYYGYRSSGFHRGLDIDGYTGQPLVAAAAGKVVSTGWNGNYGYSILIDHGNGVATRYSHLSKILVSVGQQVSQGQTIGHVGSTGRSTGSHLDFEVIINGSNVNPLNYLP